MRATEVLNEVSFRDVYPKAFAQFHDQYSPLIHHRDLYVNFTDAVGNTLDRGFSPKPNHGDPSGLYCYPLEYVLNHPMDFEYGQQARYLRVVKDTSSNRLDLQNIKMEQLPDLLMKMGANDPRQLISIVKRKPVVNKSPGMMFFFCMQWYLRTGQKSRASNQEQTKLLRMAGFDAVEDTAKNSYDAIIYPDEPEQIIFLTRSAFKVIDVYELRQAGGNINYAKRSEGLRRLPAMIATAIGDRIVTAATGADQRSEQMFYTAAKRKIVVHMTGAIQYPGHRGRATDSGDSIEVRLLGPGFEAIHAVYPPKTLFADVASDVANRFADRSASEGEEFDREAEYGVMIDKTIKLLGDIATKLKLPFTSPTSKEVAFRIWKVIEDCADTTFKLATSKIDFINKYLVGGLNAQFNGMKTRPVQYDQIIAIYNKAAVSRRVVSIAKLANIARSLGIDVPYTNRDISNDAEGVKSIDLGDGIKIIRKGTELLGEVGGREFKIAVIENSKLDAWSDPSSGGWYDQTVMLPYARAFARYLNTQKFYIRGYYAYVAQNYGLSFQDGQWSAIEDTVPHDEIGHGLVVWTIPETDHRIVCIRVNHENDLREIGHEKSVEQTFFEHLFWLNKENEITSLGQNLRTKLAWEMRKRAGELSDWEKEPHFQGDTAKIMWQKIDATGFNTIDYIKSKGYGFSPQLGEDLRFFGLVVNSDTGEIGKKLSDVLKLDGEFDGIAIFSVLSKGNGSWSYSQRRYIFKLDGKLKVGTVTSSEGIIEAIAPDLSNEYRAALRAMFAAKGIRIPKKFMSLLKKQA